MLQAGMLIIQLTRYMYIGKSIINETSNKVHGFIINPVGRLIRLSSIHASTPLLVNRVLRNSVTTSIRWTI